MKRKPMQGWLAAALLVTSLWNGTPAFAYSIGEEVKIDVSQPEISKAGFDISSDYAVWMVEGEDTITLYDLDKNTESKIGDDNSTKKNPYVDGDYVVWLDSRDGGSDVYMYDISKKKEKRITSGSAEVSQLEIAGDNVVWADESEGGSDIYLYNISTGDTKRITTSGKASNPTASDSYIAWEDTRSGHADIYYYDVKAKREKAAVTTRGDQVRPSIHQHQIVYVNKSSEYNQIQLYSISTSKDKKLTDSSDDKDFPHIYKDTYVFIEDKDLYIADVDESSSEKVAGYVYDNLAPRIYDDYVMYAKTDDSKKLRLHLYNIDDEEAVPVGEVSGEPSQPDGHDRYVVYIAEGSKANSVILYDAEKNTSKVISKTNSDPTRPLVSNRYVVWYDESEDALFSYDIRNGVQEQVTDEDDDQTPDDKLYELDGNNLLWVNVDRRAELILTDLSTEKDTEVASLKNDPLSIDLYGNYISWVVEQSSNKASVFLYDIKEEDDTEIRKNVQVKEAKLGENFVVWSEYTDAAKATWDLYYYELDREKVYPLLRYTDRDQINPQASRNMVFYEDNRLSPNKKDFYFELYNVEDASFSDIFWDDEAEVEQPRIGGNRLVWIDKRDDDPYVYTLAFAEPSDDDDGGNDPDPNPQPGEYKEYGLLDLMADGTLSDKMEEAGFDKFVLVFFSNTSKEATISLRQAFEDQDRLAELFEQADLDEISVRIYK